MPTRFQADIILFNFHSHRWSRYYIFYFTDEEVGKLRNLPRIGLSIQWRVLNDRDLWFHLSESMDLEDVKENKIREFGHRPTKYKRTLIKWLLCEVSCIRHWQFSRNDAFDRQTGQYIKEECVFHPHSLWHFVLFYTLWNNIQTI